MFFLLFREKKKKKNHSTPKQRYKSEVLQIQKLI